MISKDTELVGLADTLFILTLFDMATIKHYDARLPTMIGFNY